jgi:hypothetical protein
MAQRLPLPVGSPHPVRRLHRPRQAVERRRLITVLLGLAAAAGGAVLGAVPPSVSVGLDGAGYRVDGVVLAPRGGGVYAGPEAAVVIAPDPGGTRAAATTRLDGVPMTGSCRLAPDGRGERCTFTLGGRTVKAVDRLNGGGWDRTYGDGRRARIELAGGRPVPVPIAVGR